MKKLLLFSLILIFSCKTKSVIEQPKKSLAEICQDSFPCKIDSVSFTEYDTTYITNVKVLLKDSIQYINTETVKEVVKLKTKTIDYRTTSEFIVLKDSVSSLVKSEKSLLDSLNFYKNEFLLKTNELKISKEESQKTLNSEAKKYKTSFLVNIFLFLLLLVLAYFLGKK